MKKTLSIVIIGMLLFLSTAIIPADNLQGNDKPDQTGILDRTLIMGMLVNTLEDGQIITANVVYLFYFSPGLFISNAGVLTGLQEVSMIKSPFLFLYSPGPFGVITYVIGFARDFTIVE